MPLGSARYPSLFHSQSDTCRAAQPGSPVDSPLVFAVGRFSERGHRQKVCDAVAAKKGSGEARDSLEVIDVAQLLARSVKSNGAKAVDAGAPETAAGVTAGDVTSAGEGKPATSGNGTAGAPAAAPEADEPRP